VLMSLYWMTDPKLRLVAPFWAAMAGMFGYAQGLTRSRGGFLGLLFGLMILFISRFGMKKAIPLLAVGVPVMLVLFGGRQTDLSTSAGTGQQRIQLWDSGIDALKSTPVFGVGMNNYQQHAYGYVAHNSFIHAYVELGLVGGTLFTGIYFLAISTLWNLRKDPDQIEDPQLRRLRPYLLAVLGGEVMGLQSISRCYIESTYLLLGLGAVYLDLVSASPGARVPRLNSRLAGRLAMVGLGVLIGYIIYIKVEIRRGHF
jgi:O-antigen ligase